MKTLKTLLVLIFLNLNVHALWGKEISKSNQVSLDDLIKLEAEKVNNYESYKFTLVWIGDRPIVEIFQEVNNVSGSKHKINLRGIVTVDPQKSVFDETKAMVQLTSLKSFKAGKIVQNDRIKCIDEDTGDILLRFDTYDLKENLRMSQWRTLRNGFPVEEVIFDENGKPLSMTYYFKYRINSEGLSLSYIGKHYHFNLDYAQKVVGPVQFENLDDCINFCKKLLQQALVRSGGRE